MRRLAGVAALSVLAALLGSTYAFWWLAVDQTAAIDTLRAQASATVDVPTDGTSIAQSFSLPAAGSTAACVWLENERRTAADVLLQIHADVANQPAQVLGRTVTTIDAGRRRCLAAPLPPLTWIAARRLWLTIRLIGAQSPQAVRVVVATAPSLPAERLLIGTTERWGTLGMKIDAPGTTRWASDWPVELYRPSSRLGLAAMLGTGGLIAASMLLLSATCVSTSPVAAWSVVASVPMGLLLLHGATHWTHVPEAPRYAGVGRALIDELGHATLRTTAGALGAGFTIVTSDIRRPADRALFALPESAVSWPLRVSDPTSLDTAAALRQEAWTRPGDGVTFTVTVTSDGHTDVLWRRHVDPFLDPAARQWTDVTVRLDRYVGKAVILTLATEAGPAGNAVMDAAMWREPVLRPSVVR